MSFIHLPDVRLGTDPALKYVNTAKGSSAVCSFSVAFKPWQKDLQPSQRKVHWFRVTVWGGMAEFAAETFTKGDLINVTGKLDLNVWVTKEGEQRADLTITGDSVSPSLRYNPAQIIRTERQEPATQAATQQTYTQPEYADI